MTVTQGSGAAAAVVEHADPFAALAQALDTVHRVLRGRPATLALLFAGPGYEPAYPRLVAEACRRLDDGVLIGCSGEGIIGPGREVERRPALALAAVSLPDARFPAVHLEMPEITPGGAAELVAATGVPPGAARGWLILADPYTVDGEALIHRFQEAYPEAVILGGMASSLWQSSHVFLHDRAYPGGAVALAVTPPYALRPVVSQGASPLGEPWTITAARGNLVESIGGRPAYDVLTETLRSLPPDLLERARAGLLVGLAMDEYRESFRRGDFLIRNLLGYHPETGALAVTAAPRVGQTIQFQFRDAQAADEDLREQLAACRQQLGPAAPVAAVLCSCNGRGRRMFETPDHDARLLDEAFPGLPVAGLFCAGEIGTVGRRAFLHGFTASIGLLVREGEP